MSQIKPLNLFSAGWSIPKVRGIKFSAMSTYKKWMKGLIISIKPSDKEEIDDAVSLINEYNSDFVRFMSFYRQIF